MILKVLRSTDTHPTADWIYQQVRESLPNISLGTVYRNLRTLVENGEILELSYGSTFSRFDGNPENHYHFTCEKCGNVYDLDLPVRKELDEAVEKLGMKVQSHRLEFYGICHNCQGH
ncbi:MAG: Fur family transcriptional regulator [Limnochordia bacterium]